VELVQDHQDMGVAVAEVLGLQELTELQRELAEQVEQEPAPT